MLIKPKYNMLYKKKSFLCNRFVSDQSFRYWYKFEIIVLEMFEHFMS